MPPTNKHGNVAPKIQPVKSQYEEMQEDELLALEAIYAEDFRRLESHHGAWKVRRWMDPWPHFLRVILSDTF